MAARRDFNRLAERPAIPRDMGKAGQMDLV